MTFSVRLFCYPGVVTAPLSAVRQVSTDSVLLLRQPYIATSNQKLASNGATPVVSVATPKQTKLLRVEVDDGNTIRFELQTPNGAGGLNGNSASTNSPSMSGRELLDCGEGFVFSFVDASATP